MPMSKTELLEAAQEAYVVAEDRRNRQRATFKNGRRQLRCTKCGCWRRRCGAEGYPECRRCGDDQMPKAVYVYPRPENSPSWGKFLADFIAEDAEDRAYIAARVEVDEDPIPF